MLMMTGARRRRKTFMTTTAATKNVLEGVMLVHFNQWQQLLLPDNTYLRIQTGHLVVLLKKTKKQ
jgi:hypothetical protein